VLVCVLEACQISWGHKIPRIDEGCEKRLIPTWYLNAQISEKNALFVWLISHQPAVLFSHNKSTTSNQAAVLFSQIYAYLKFGL
jgi:hypothetical protein